MGEDAGEELVFFAAPTTHHFVPGLHGHIQ